jgi:hypothetical protein
VVIGGWCPAPPMIEQAMYSLTQSGYSTQPDRSHSMSAELLPFSPSGTQAHISLSRYRALLD